MPSRPAAHSGPLRRLALAALLALVAGISAWRAGGLAADPTTLSAERERRSFAWAWREPEAARIFARLEEQLPPGWPVRLVVAPGQGHNAQWWRFMASYHLDDNPVLEARVKRPGAVVPGEGLVIVFPVRGEPVVRGQEVPPGSPRTPP